MPHDGIIYVIDDEPEMRRSLEMLFAVEGLESRSFASAEAFLDALHSLPKGIILGDISLGGMSGFELLLALPSLGRSDPVILITGNGDIPLAVAAIKAGAADFLEKPFEPHELLNALKLVRQRISSSTDIEKCLASLSRRERQVLRHIVEGMTAKQTAARLEISPRTVETYREQLMKKTGATGLSQLVRFGIAARV